MADQDRRIIEAVLSESARPAGRQRTLRELAIWYREFAERAGSATIWEARLRMAEDLDGEADRLERQCGFGSNSGGERGDD